MTSLYPIKFKPIFKEKIWGGNKIKTIFGKNFSPLQNCGESWELSGVDKNISIVENGFLAGNSLEELAEIYMSDLMGEKCFDKYGHHFPILIKIIDSQEWLSIQVHPDDNLAMRRHRQYGKSEMWYILQSDKNAQLISGFNKEMDKNEYLHNFNNKTLKNILNIESVSAGDAFHIPAGRVHALGPGVCLAEIQQTSDITYRIYDWDRTDVSGLPRDLHVELALGAIDFKYYDNYKINGNPIEGKSKNLVHSPHFTTNIISLIKPQNYDYFNLDSFVIYFCTEGRFVIEYTGGETSVMKGETVLIPAEFTEINLVPEPAAELLEIYL